MAPSTSSPDSPPPTTAEATENDLQPFFILQKSSYQKSGKKSTGTRRARRRIDLSPSLPKNSENKDNKKAEGCDNFHYINMRMEAFEAVWSKIESTIKDVLRDINNNVFNEIHKWVCESFNNISSAEKLGFAEATQSFPIVAYATPKQLFTGLVFTRNMEFVDDQMTFKELGMHLKSQGCHVANLSSLEFSTKNGIGGCLRSLLRQFLMVTLDAPDISVLATWYREQKNFNNPVVIIIDDVEQCSGFVLSDLILMLSEWVLRMPIILIMGVATTLDSLRNILPSHVLHHLCTCKFVLGTPSQRLDAVVEAVILKHCSGFSIGHKVAVFMRNYFLSQDGTIMSFIRALKIACAQHFSLEPLSSLSLWFLLDGDNQVLTEEKYGVSPEMILKNAFDLPSCRRDKLTEQNGESLAHGLSELKKLQSQWSIVLQCLYEAGKCEKIQLLDLLCEALDPELCKIRVSDTDRDIGKDCRVSPKGGFICRVIHKVRDLPAVQLHKLLKVWEKNTLDFPQIHKKVKELLSMLKFEDGKSLKEDLIVTSKCNRRPALRSNLNTGKNRQAVNENAARLIESMVRDYLRPVECIAFHEIVCFRDVEKLQAALVGDPRRRIQVDLLEFPNIMQCCCCSRSSNTPLPSMHDTSIMYALAQEHGDLINLHDWYQSFKSIVLCSSKRGKHRSKFYQSPKKRKVVAGPAKPSEASIQARFCRAVTELQITGLLRMPSRRRPDFVQRVAFGL